MARSLGNVIADSLELGVGYAKRLLDGVPADQCGQLASPGVVVASNHPAFIYGHLSLYGPRIVRLLGDEADNLNMPARFETLFSKDAQCEHDPDGNLYPPMEEISELFFNGYQAATAALRTVDEAPLEQPNPNEGRLAELFPTVGSMFTFYAGGHLMMHLGQMSAWRRMMGYGPA